MIYAIAWIIPIVLFWIFLREAPMLFFIIAYTWYPLFAGVISCVVVSKQELGIWKWSVPPIVCVLNVFVFYVTYAITNALSMSNVAWDNWSVFILNVIGALIGLGIGIVVFRYKRSN